MGKGYDDFKIGDTVFINGSVLTIKSCIVKPMHKTQDRRTKKVSTVIWCLFSEDGIEYRKTSYDLANLISFGNAKRLEGQ